MRADGLGVAGINSTKEALENGHVETLLVDPQSEILDQDTRNELIRLAETTGATVEMIEDNEKFAAMQGVGGLPRYKLQGEHPADEIDSRYSLDSKDPLNKTPKESESEAALSARE